MRDELDEMARRFRALLRLLSRAEELADDIALRLEKLAGGPASGPAPAKRRKADKEESLRQLAESGVFSVEIAGCADGAVEVRVDLGKPFRLPPLLGDLLEILCLEAADEWPEDELVGWKSLDEVSRRLGKRQGREFKRHAVTQAVHRLRKELFDRGGVNPFLVQTNRRLGARFALRRRKPAVIEAAAR